MTQAQADATMAEAVRDTPAAVLSTFERLSVPRPPFMDADPLTVAPLVPEEVLRRHGCVIASDSRFRSATRLLAALWRESQNLPVGFITTSVNASPAKRSKRRKALPIGSHLSTAAARAGATFLDPAIATLARQSLLFRESGAMWSEDRLWANLLSSQALTINLLAPMALDFGVATAVWQRLLPGFVHEVTGLRFEHSPGRFQDAYFGDGTAFDAIVECITPDGEVAVVTIEVKFVEDMLGPAASPRVRYDETAFQSGLFIDPDRAILRRPGFEQLRREHVMSQLMLDNGLAGQARFVLIGPRLNRRVAQTAELYAKELVDPSGASPHDDGRARVGFIPLTMEAVVEALAEAGAQDFARAFWVRYLDLNRVAEVALKSPDPANDPGSAPAAKAIGGNEGEPTSVPSDAVSVRSRRRRLASQIQSRSVASESAAKEAC